jgi:hypothetical protein
VRNFVSQGRVLKGEWKARWSSELSNGRQVGEEVNFFYAILYRATTKTRMYTGNGRNLPTRSVAMEGLERFITVPVSYSRNAELVFIKLSV